MLCISSSAFLIYSSALMFLSINAQARSSSLSLSASDKLSLHPCLDSLLISSSSTLNGWDAPAPNLFALSSLAFLYSSVSCQSTSGCVSAGLVGDGYVKTCFWGGTIGISPKRFALDSLNHLCSSVSTLSCGRSLDGEMEEGACVAGGSSAAGWASMDHLSLASRAAALSSRSLFFFWSSVSIM